MELLNIISVKKFCLIAVLTALALSSVGQETKADRKKEKQKLLSARIRQAEEGILVFNKQSIFGLQARTNGYGIFYEVGKMKTNRKTNIYRIDITEIKSAKEEKLLGGGIIFGNPFIYGKVNYFYPITLAFGQQYMLGQKGNKNGVAVSAVYNAGLSIGLLRPYYVSVDDPITGTNRTIKYSVEDSALFLGPTITGGGGFGKGWSEVKIKPGAFAKVAMRFDYGPLNESIKAWEIGMSIEAYGSKIPLMLKQPKDKSLFFQGYISIQFGRRK
jgi:hypothetical protein